MRIAYTCHDSFPSPDTNTHQIFWTIVEVARRGVDIDLFTPPAKTGREPTIHELASYYGVSNGTPLQRISVAVLGRQLAENSTAKGWFDWRVPRRLGANVFDLVWTRDPLAVMSCLRAGRPVMFETYRPDFATYRRFEVWRRACLKNPKLFGVMTHSDIARRAFVGAGVPADRCVVVHNGFAPSVMEPLLDRDDARRRLGLQLDTPLIVYAGHVGREKGTAALVEMAARLPDATLLLVGIDPSSVEARWVEDILRKTGVRNVLTRPRVRVGEVAPYLYAADCLIVPPTDEPLRRFRRTVLPMKVFTYLAAGRPIVAPRLPDIEEVLTDGETARLVPPNPSSAASAVTELLANRTLQERLSREALRHSKRYTWEARARRIVEFLSRFPFPNP